MSMDEETLSKRRSGTAQWDSSVDRDPQLHARPHLTCAAPTVHINAFKKRAMRLKSYGQATRFPSKTIVTKMFKTYFPGLVVCLLVRGRPPFRSRTDPAP